jgi:hypothetical protein
MTDRKKRTGLWQQDLVQKQRAGIQAAGKPARVDINTGAQVPARSAGQTKRRIQNKNLL